MSDVNIILTPLESSCVFSAVTSELLALEDDVASGELSSTDCKNAIKSISICKEVLLKLSSASSNPTYEFI